MNAPARRDPSPDPTSPTTTVPGTAAQEAQPISIDEAIARYPGEWIVLQVTGYDQNHIISHGIVLAHTSSYDEAQKIMFSLPFPPPPPGGPYYIREGYPQIRTGAELRQALKELAENPERWTEW